MWYPFKRQRTSAYHHLGKADQHGDDAASDGPLESAATLVYQDEHAYFSAHGLVRPKPTCPGRSILLALTSLLIGLVAGHSLRIIPRTVDGYLPPFTSPHPSHPIFTLNASFAAPPSPSTSALWASLMPAGRGFVSHPLLTNGSVKAVTAFHQLHCLHALRTAYAAQTDALVKLRQHGDGNAYLDGLTERERGLRHVTHCVEYLRQGIVCAADTNLEETRVLEGGMVEAVAFGGGKRVCRDWEGVRSWAEKWSAGGGEGIV